MSKTRWGVPKHPEQMRREGAGAFSCREGEVQALLGHAPPPRQPGKAALGLNAPHADGKPAGRTGAAGECARPRSIA